MKILIGFYKKKTTTNKAFQKRFMKGTKIFLKKKKTKSTNVLMSNIEKKRSVNMVVNDI